MARIFIFITLMTILSACQVFDRIVNWGNYVPRETQAEKLYVYDTVYITNNNGIIDEAKAGEKPIRQLVFSTIGQSISFRTGETIEVVLDGIDFSTTTFDVTTDESTNLITYKLVDKDANAVLLKKKCDVVIRTGITTIPKIEIGKDMKLEQVISTPLFDENCNQIGWEIRYGSVENGCRSKSIIKNLRTFKDCTGKSTVQVTEGTYKKDPCRNKKKLGIPCP